MTPANTAYRILLFFLLIPKIRMMVKVIIATMGETAHDIIANSSMGS